MEDRDVVASAAPCTINGRYTRAVVEELTIGLNTVTLGAEPGIILVAGGSSWEKWLETLTTKVSAEVHRDRINNALPTAYFACVALGSHYTATLVAQPLDEDAEHNPGQLFDVIWGNDPTTVASLTARVSPAARRAQLLSQSATLVPLPAVELLTLCDTVLTFASRQYTTLAMSARAIDERLRHHEDQTRMIVHDMRAPLHTMMMTIKSLQRQTFDAVGQTQLFGVAHESASYLLNLVETMLDSARLEASSWTLRLQPLRLATLIRSVCEPLELAGREAQAPLRYDIEDNLPVIHADRTLIERVLANLVANAIKYTPRHGEVLISARRSAEIDAVELTVRDTGRGIAPEAQRHIFERFYQATGSDQRRGSGIGLYFCRLAVEAHGGNIRVESSLGVGSTFTVTLPLGRATSSMLSSAYIFLVLSYSSLRAAPLAWNNRGNNCAARADYRYPRNLLEHQPNRRPAFSLHAGDSYHHRDGLGYSARYRALAAR
ncbi:HAMP domain-containing histidine kinase [Candidatus Gracilibacteria bacterium]|nr:HAMP domain-containing histidine kinase [Candidatus Gracilibacteria bacterium]